jgi:hypothetical protein
MHSFFNFGSHWCTGNLTLVAVNSDPNIEVAYPGFSPYTGVTALQSDVSATQSTQTNCSVYFPEDAFVLDLVPQATSNVRVTDTHPDRSPEV